MAADGSPLEVSDALDGVVWLTLDRPERRNALSIDLRDEVSDALDRLAEDQSVRVVVLTGAGDGFSAGFDLREFEDPDGAHQRRLWASSDRFHHTVLRFPLPLIAAVNGPALAGGFDLTVLADIRLASDTAWFSHPEQAWADVVYRPLRELVGGGVARDLVLTGRRIDAHEALRLGLVSQVVPSAELDAVVRATAAMVAAAPRAVLMRTKAKIVAAAGIDEGLSTLEL
jgi:enoyl-CoA hydratase/carnithine racemase